VFMKKVSIVNCIDEVKMKRKLSGNFAVVI
jgi:hypothetical protein